VSRLPVAIALILGTVACNPKSLKSGYCNQSTDCASGTCNADHRCSSTDGSTDGPEAGDVADGNGRDGGDVHDVAPPRCPQTIACADGGYDGSPGVCEPDAGVCVECLQDKDCSQDPKTPICDAHLCRACKTDTECPDPAICMTDGHCATSGEVMFVEFNSNGCPGATGSSTNPYCAPNDAVAHVATGKNVIIIRGPIADRLTINTTGSSPAIVGKNGASIPATAATAIQVLSDTVLIRDLTVTGGTAATSKGIIVSGATTMLTLSNLQVSLGTGLGIQADSGAELTMEHCNVAGNNKGGILIDAASFDLKNVTVTANGPGDDIGTTWGGIRIKNPPAAGPKTLQLVTVQNNNNTGISCTEGVSGTGVLASGNGGGVDITTSTCGFSSCGTSSPTCGSP
jgi:hypothetical protein